MATTYKAPAKWAHDKPSVFLAGTIDNGNSVDWQAKATQVLDKYDINIINPRRDDWDPSWKQSINDPQFNEQVNWELDSLDRVDLIIMYFAEGSLSPISLLEFGLFAKSHKMAVACDLGYWRRGNIEVVCARNGIHLYDNIDDLLTDIYIETNGRPHHG
jgi:hypothetical protein